MGAVTGKTEAVEGKVGHTDFTFYISRNHFVKRHTFYISRTHFVKRPKLIKSQVSVNSRVVIYGANELPICKKPKCWPPNVKGLKNRSPLVKRKAFN